VVRNRRLAWLCLSVACAYETPHSRQAAVLAQLTPDELTPTTRPVAAQTVRTIKVMAMVDDDSRTESRDFEARLRQQFELASTYTKDTLGLRFEIVAMRTWSHRAGTAPLGRSLEALERAEHGEGVDLVVGFVSSLPVIEASQDQLGMGQLFSKHLVLRGWNDGLQMVALLNELRALDDDEKVAFVRKRRAHQLTVLLLQGGASMRARSASRRPRARAPRVPKSSHHDTSIDRGSLFSRGDVCARSPPE
jgi:hypothetical protein